MSASVLRLGGGSVAPAFRALPAPANDAQFAAYKLARTVVKNLLLKGAQDEKYRRLKTSNPKVAAKLLTVPAAVEFLRGVGFEQVGEELVYGKDINTAQLQCEFDGIDALLRGVQQERGQPAGSDTTAAMATSNTENRPARKNTGAARIDPTLCGSRSIKAQIRAKEEAKQRALRDAQRKQRKQLMAKIQSDKEARKQPGWSAKISSANMGAQPSAQANF